MHQSVWALLFLLTTLALELVAGCFFSPCGFRQKIPDPVVSLNNFLVSHTASDAVELNIQTAKMVADSEEMPDVKELAAMLAEFSLSPDVGKCSGPNVANIHYLFTQWKGSNKPNSLGRIQSLIRESSHILSECFTYWSTEWKAYNREISLRFFKHLKAFDRIDEKNGRHYELQQLDLAINRGEQCCKKPVEFNVNEAQLILDSFALSHSSEGLELCTPRSYKLSLQMLSHVCKQFQEEKPVEELLEPLVMLAEMTGLKDEIEVPDSLSLNSFLWAGRLATCKQLIAADHNKLLQAIRKHEMIDRQCFSMF